MSSLLLAEEMRHLISSETKVGIIDLPEEYCFSHLEFGFSTKPADVVQKTIQNNRCDEGKNNHNIQLNIKEGDHENIQQNNEQGTVQNGAKSVVENGLDNIVEISEENLVESKWDVSVQQSAAICDTSKENEENPSHRNENGIDERLQITKSDDDVVSLDKYLSKRNSGVFEEIDFDSDIDLESFVGPSPCVILQALTMSNANDFFNLERLETIGDSYLKFAITIHLYCMYPGIHEGKLSYLRSKQVSNYNLYRLGKLKKFPSFMVAAKFEPTENWLPPGYAVQSINFPPLNSAKNENKSEKSTMKRVESSAAITEMERFTKELEAASQVEETSDGTEGLIPYNLQTQHSLPDKSIADVVESLIGCYLITCSQRAALRFMSWVGLNVLSEPPKQHAEKTIIESKTWQLARSQLDNKVQNVTPESTFPSPHCSLGVGCDLAEYLNAYSAFEESIDYKFNDRLYLLQAFTHASYHYNTITDCYQR